MAPGRAPPRSVDFKPFAQSLYIDLSEDPHAAARPTHLGFHLGRDALVDFLGYLQKLGVNHVILNLKYGRRPAPRCSASSAAWSFRTSLRTLPSARGSGREVTLTRLHTCPTAPTPSVSAVARSSKALVSGFDYIFLSEGGGYRRRR